MSKCIKACFKKVIAKVWVKNRKLITIHYFCEKSEREPILKKCHVLAKKSKAGMYEVLKSK